MSGPPPTQYSPDGKYYWDGQRWAPVLPPAQQLLPPQPSPYAAPPQMYPQPMYPPHTNGLATASLVFGIASWVICPFIGAIVAVITGHMAKSQIKRTGEGGSGQATAGLVLGYIHLAGVAVVTLFWLFVFGGMAALLIFSPGTTNPSGSPTPFLGQGVSNEKIDSPTKIEFDYIASSSCTNLFFDYKFFNSSGDQVDEFNDNAGSQVVAGHTYHFTIDANAGQTIDPSAVRFEADATCNA